MRRLRVNVVFKNYKVFYPLLAPSGKFKLLLLIREAWAAKYNPSVLRTTAREIWVRLEAPGGVIATGSIYRQWTDWEEEDLVQLCDQMTEVSGEFSRVLIMGDANLDMARIGDTCYYRRRLLRCLDENELSLANLQDMTPTYYSHGTFDDAPVSGNVRKSFDMVMKTPVSKFGAI